MMNNIKNIKNIAYIQNVGLLTNEQILKYMGDIKYLSSDDPTIIYKFIVCCNKCYKITNFCLMIGSGTLGDLNMLIKNNRKLDKCIFIATLSNANSVRDVIAKNIYFSISAINIVIKAFLNIPPNYVMTIVSDTISPFYDQIYITGPKPAYRISELTVEKVNEFVDNGTGISILVALDDLALSEYALLNNILLDPACKYKNFASFIEVNTKNVQEVIKLNDKLTKVNNLASNVSLCGVTDAYPDINSLTLYQNCAIQFVNFYNKWEKFIEQAQVFNRFTLTKKKLAIDPIPSTNFEILNTATSISYPP